MKSTGDVLINRTSGLIVLISSIIMIALMVTGGCDSSNGNSSPTPTPGPTGFPPECDGTFGVDLSCPAESLEGSVCLPYFCDIIDDSEPPGNVIDTITIVFGDHCTASDCFTLGCQDIFNGTVFNADSATIVIETVDGTPVGEDTMGEVNMGVPDGRIIIDGEDFALDCQGFITP